MTAKFILSNRSVIKIEGADASSFLQGLMTNDIKKATSETLLYAMFLSPQGRFLADFMINKVVDGFLLDIPAWNKDEIIKKLSVYKLRAQAQIIDLSESIQVVADLTYDITAENFFKDPRSDEIGSRGFVTSDSSSGFLPMEVYNIKRIELKIPDAEYDFFYDRSLPLEFRAIQLAAIDFNKGCYVGQEVTARTHHRGVVRKTLFNFEVMDGLLPPEKGSEIISAGNKIGTILGGSNKFGLALINFEELEKEPKRLFEINNQHLIMVL